MASVNIFVDGNSWTTSNPINVTADGISYRTVRVVCSPSSPGNTVTLQTTAIGAFSSLDGQLDSNSAFEFIVGPDFRRGNSDVVIHVDGFANKTLQVSFR
jgi:hypothetical protein